MERIWMKKKGTSGDPVGFPLVDGKLSLRSIAELWNLQPSTICVGPVVMRIDTEGRSVETISEIRELASGTASGDGMSKESPFIVDGAPARAQDGTDDDLPPSQSARVFRGGRATGNGRTISGSGHYGRSGADQHLRKLEKDAYVAVLRAFTAQSEVITWRKEQLLVTLRQELRISDEQHLEVLKGMDSNAAPQQFRDRRLPEEEHGGSMYAPNVDLAVGARKKPKTSHSLQANLPPPPMKSAFPSPSPPPPPPVTSHAKRAPPGGGSRSKKSKGGRQHANASSSKPLQFGGMPPADGSISGINPWVGKRVKIRWPADNSFYEAVVSDWDPEKDLHALVYEMNTVNETWEWVDLKELSSNDLQTIDGPLVNVIGKNPPSFGVGGRGATGRGTKKGAGRNNLMSSYEGWARPSSKGPSNSMERSTPGMPTRNWKTSNVENGLDTKGSRQLQVPSLDALVKQVDRIAEEDDLAKIESIKRAAKEHEDMLRKALAEVGESSEEGESDEENVPFSHAHSVERERERRSRQDSREQHGYDDEDDTAGDRDEGSDGEPMAAHGGVASDADDDHHDGDDW